MVLKISKGPAEVPGTTTTPPATEPDNYTETLYTLILDEPVQEDCILTIWRDNELVEEREVYAGTVSVELRLRGEGVMEFTAMLDDDTANAWTFEVNFSSYADGI